MEPDLLDVTSPNMQTDRQNSPLPTLSCSQPSDRSPTFPASHLAKYLGTETIALLRQWWAITGKSCDCPNWTNLSKTIFLSLITSPTPHDKIGSPEHNNPFLRYNERLLRKETNVRLILAFLGLKKSRQAWSSSRKPGWASFLCSRVSA